MHGMLIPGLCQLNNNNKHYLTHNSKCLCSRDEEAELSKGRTNKKLRKAGRRMVSALQVRGLGFALSLIAGAVFTFHMFRIAPVSERGLARVQYWEADVDLGPFCSVMSILCVICAMDRCIAAENTRFAPVHEMLEIISHFLNDMRIPPIPSPSPFSFFPLEVDRPPKSAACAVGFRETVGVFLWGKWNANGADL
jgi:hypothetical protein